MNVLETVNLGRDGPGPASTSLGAVVAMPDAIEKLTAGHRELGGAGRALEGTR